MSTSKTRPEVASDVWLAASPPEWARGSGDTLMALACRRSTMALHTLMSLVSSARAGLGADARPASACVHRPPRLPQHIWMPVNRKHLGGDLSPNDLWQRPRRQVTGQMDPGRGEEGPGRRQTPPHSFSAIINKQTTIALNRWFNLLVTHLKIDSYVIKN